MEGENHRSTIEDPLRLFIQNLNNNYVHWDKFKDMQLPLSGNREEIWQQVVKEREQGYTRKLYYHNQHISWWLSNALEAQLHRMDIDLAGGRGMDVLLENKQTHRHKTHALLEESITSALLAGISVSKKMAKEMLLKKRPPQNTEEQVCVNIYRTLQFAFSQKDEVLTEALLLQIHQTLTKDTIKQKGIGRYRTNNKVDESLIDGAAGYKPPQAAQLNQLMSVVFELYNNDQTPFFIHPLVKAGILHYLILSIRPFKDGNGRMGRILAQMYLLKKGYWVAEFLSVSNVISKLRTQYHKAIVQSQTDGNNIGYFIHFYIQSLQMALRSLKDLVQRITKEKSESAAVKLPGYNERQTAVIQWLKEDAEKVVTIRELRSVYGISKETARTDLIALVNKGWIKYYHINKKTYAFVKGDQYEQLMQNNG
ncbi:hypothetical protein PIECOFPK_00504 [Mycovorax composti]|jgi:Uncharacterized conserved protein|uniref:Fido domain-containing protein n=2 Tax=Chitinophagaceae TaxID=563835 RepID=A0ABZ2EHD4_9BACT